MSQTEFYRGAEAAAAALARPHRDAAAAAAAVHGALLPLLSERAERPAQACAAGCAHCCHFPVGVTFGEAQRLALALQEAPELRHRLLAAADATRELAWRGLVGVPCPLLHDGRCTAYAARPLPCRAMASRDADACAQALAGGPTPPLDAVAFWRGLGAADTLAQASAPTGSRELRSALAALLAADANGSDPAAAFAAARRPPAD